MTNKWYAAAAVLGGLVVVGLLALLPLSIRSTSGSASATVSIGSCSEPAGEDCTVALEIANVPAPGVMGATINILYDPSIVDPVSYSPGPGWDMAQCSLAYEKNGIAPDVVRCANVKAAGLTGGALIADLTFDVEGEPGECSNLELSIVSFADPAGLPIPVTGQNGQICVEVQTSTPTPTPTATSTPTATATNTPLPTATPTPTLTPTKTPTLTPTKTPTLTPTKTPTLTPTLTPTKTLTPTPTLTSTPTPTLTPCPDGICPTATPTATDTPVPAGGHRRPSADTPTPVPPAATPESVVSPVAVTPPPVVEVAPITTGPASIAAPPTGSGPAGDGVKWAWWTALGSLTAAAAISGLAVMAIRRRRHSR